jgi:fibro-slime domain-containing protein
MKKLLSRVAGVCVMIGCSAGGSSGGSTVGEEGGGTGSESVVDVPNNPAFIADTPSGGLFGESDVNPPDTACDGVIPITYRDFSDTHPDFEMDFRGDVVRRQLIAPQLTGSKPTFSSSIGCPAQQNSPTACADWDVEQPVITSAASFDQWYRDVPGVNFTFERTLELLESAPGSGLYTFNSNSFFPIANTEGFLVTPPGRDKNFLFTTEIHLNFEYVRGQRFTFRGDDDLWIFINSRIALDLGSLHSAESGTIDFDAQASALGITPGQAYSMDIFHAERHTDQSNFSLETNIACFTPSVVR